MRDVGQRDADEGGIGGVGSCDAEICGEPGNSSTSERSGKRRTIPQQRTPRLSKLESIRSLHFAQHGTAEVRRLTKTLVSPPSPPSHAENWKHVVHGRGELEGCCAEDWPKRERRKG